MGVQDRIEFKVYDDRYVSYGKRVYEVYYTQGTTPDNFIGIYDKLASKYGLTITENFLSRFYNEAYGKELSLQEREKLPFPYIDHLVGFILDLDFLLNKHVSIPPLIKEFHECNNSDELHHAFHLAGLAAICCLSKHKVQFPEKSKDKRNPDLTVDKIPSDLKVIRPPDVKKLHSVRGSEFESELREDLCYDIGKAIENRLCIGIEQADLVFIDLAAKSLPIAFLGIMVNAFPDKYYVVIPELRRFRVIFYCMTMLPSNQNRRLEGDLPYSFFGTYIDIDPKLWQIVKQGDLKITHKEGEGRYIL